MSARLVRAAEAALALPLRGSPAAPSGRIPLERPPAFPVSEKRRAAEAALALPHKRAGGSAVRPYSARTAPGFSRQRKAAGRRGSSEDDLPLRLNHAQDLGVGRGLNPAPDERGPATR